MSRATDVIDFIQLLKIPEGSKVGEPLVLEKFQRDFVKAIYDNKHGTRSAFLSVARKNGKSALIAAILLAHIVGPEAKRNTQVVSGARSRDQAALVWALAVKMIDLEPALQDITHIIPSSKKILGLPMNVEFKALAADGAKVMGLSPALAVLDEVGQVVGPTDYFTDAITSSQGAHENPLLIAISTQSPTDADMWSLWLDDAVRSKDRHTVCHIYAADKDCDLMDKKQWKKANPALGKFLNEKYVSQEMEKAERMPSEEAKARNLLLNQRVAQESLWLAPKIWAENNAEPDLEVFQLNGAHMGLDLSMRNDLTAACLAATDDDGNVHLKMFAFSPLGGIEERSRRDKVPYADWARTGVIHAPHGDTLNYDMIAKHLMDELSELGIDLLSIQFDRYRINDFKAACDRVGFAQDVPFEEVGQGFLGFTTRVDAFETLLLERRIRHGGHPVLNLAAASAIIVTDASNNRKLDKNKSSQKIDGLVAACMSVHPLLGSAPDEFDATAIIG